MSDSTHSSDSIPTETSDNIDNNGEEGDDESIDFDFLLEDNGSASKKECKVENSITSKEEDKINNQVEINEGTF